MLRLIRRFFALRAARQAQRDHDLYQSQPEGAGWNLNIATALRERVDIRSFQTALGTGLPL